ncbi:uncharacterized protein TRAVEDRAFT_52063 [Trametes versicolor FP-101664 SS1]|uniref:uncharacterized protein n=1 Tax=Trametes versicolor (strain FP-101664) TaxID=717944 RepID=UPI0004621A6E|nr:uncharacterized protein TRAVEDRAFT_52063 [Trametes versicolor FP-101664 SS1]EIW54355.1 hypothetical protein TRAVEDRAFT_52063 [Trametes versicolor FP-101664 SS1]
MLTGASRGLLAITPIERLDYKHCLLFDCVLPDDPRPLDDSTVLTRGDYVCCYTGPTGIDTDRISHSSHFFPDDVYTLPRTLQVLLDEDAAFSEMYKSSYSGNPETLNPYLAVPATITPELCNMAWEKYAPKCMFTGSTGDAGDRSVGVYWIYPPTAHSRMLAYSCVPRRTCQADFTQEDMEVAANVVTMRADIHRLWLANAISVDVDDGYRIVVFDKIAQATQFFTRLRFDAQDHNSLRDDFFREQFRYTLAVRLLGGHLVPHDVRRGDVMEFLGKVKYAPDKVTPRASDLKHKKWRTRVGKVALQHIQAMHPNLKLELPEHLIKGGSLEEEDTDESTDEEDTDVVATEDESD